MPDAMEHRINRGTGPFTTFPEDLGEHAFAITFRKYNRQKLTEKPRLKEDNTIVLPIPANLQESVSLQWGDTELGAIADIGITGLTVAGESVAKNFKSGTYNTSVVTDALKAIKDVYNKEISGITAETAIDQGALTALPGEFENAYSANRGVTKNPHVALIFRGSEVREHSFTWRLIPQTPKESSILRDIIRELRYNALPNKRDTLILEYPSVCNLTILGSQAGYLPFYKSCVITNVQVNYAPDGFPQFFNTSGAPSQIELTVSLKETSQLFRNDLEILDPGHNGRLLGGVE